MRRRVPLKELWEEIPDQSRQRILQKLGLIVGQKLTAPSPPKEVLHEEG